jgi:hypothetical protein
MSEVSQVLEYPDGQQLPRGHDSLAHGVPQAVPGAVHALALLGGYSVGPRESRVIYFGRNRPDVHVCIGEDDRQISRVQGDLTHWEGRWWLRNTGRRPIRLPKSRWLFVDEQPVPLADGYTPMVIPGSHEREHLLEVYVTGTDGNLPVSRHADETEPPQPYDLSDEERLILVVVGQRYLLHEPYPQPLTWLQAAQQLSELQGVPWTERKVAGRVAAVRERLSQAGLTRVVRAEVEEPIGNTLNDNLLQELLHSATIKPKDLAALDRPVRECDQ